METSKQTHVHGCITVPRISYPPPPSCASTALSKHGSPSDRCFPDRSFRFPLMGTALSQHGTRLTVILLTFSVPGQGGGVGQTLCRLPFISLRKRFAPWAEPLCVFLLNMRPSFDAPRKRSNVLHDFGGGGASTTSRWRLCGQHRHVGIVMLLTMPLFPRIWREQRHCAQTPLPKPPAEVMSAVLSGHRVSVVSVWRNACFFFSRCKSRKGEKGDNESRCMLYRHVAANQSTGFSPFGMHLCKGKCTQFTERNTFLELFMVCDLQHKNVHNR